MTRKNAKDFTSDERQRYCNALLTLKQTTEPLHTLNQYDEFVAIHFGVTRRFRNGISIGDGAHFVLDSSNLLKQNSSSFFNTVYAQTDEQTDSSLSEETENKKRILELCKELPIPKRPDSCFFNVLVAEITHAADALVAALDAERERNLELAEENKSLYKQIIDLQSKFRQLQQDQYMTNLFLAIISTGATVFSAYMAYKAHMQKKSKRLDNYF